MVGEDKILARLHRSEQAVARLRRVYAQGWNAYRADPDLQDISDRNLQVAIERCIDIANHIIAAQGLRLPQSSGDAFSVLAEASLLPADLAERLARAAGLRNIIVHEYLQVDRRLLFESLSQLSDLTEFARHMVALLENHES